MRLIFTALFLALATGSLSAQNWAIQVDSGSLKFPHHSSMNTGATVTIEAWVRATTKNPAGSLALFSRYLGSREHKSVVAYPDGKIDIVYAGSPWSHPPTLWSPTGVLAHDQKWHHVGLTREANGHWATWVDGKAVKSGGPGPCWLTCNIINANTPTEVAIPNNSPGDWQMDSVRVSTVARYTQNFIPAHHWATDQDTVMLLHFNEGTGSTTRDLSSNSQLGTFTGGFKWVKGIGPAPSASYTSYRQSCSSSVGIPRLANVNLPMIGSVFQLQTTQLGGSKSGAMLIGFDDQQWRGLPLPFDLGTIGATGCMLNLDPVVTLFAFSDANGTADTVIPIPNDPIHLGLRFFAQYISIDDAPASRPLKLSVTNAGKGVIGI